MMTEKESVITLRDILSFYFKHQLRILFIFFSTTICVTVLVYYFPEKYEVIAKLLVKMGRENASISPTITNPSIWQIGKQMKEIVNSEAGILESTHLVEKLVSELGVDFFDPKREPPETVLQKLRAATVFIVNKVKNFFLAIAYKLDIIREITPFEQTVLGIKKNLSVSIEKDSNILNVIYRTPVPENGKTVLNKLIELYLESRIGIHKNQGVYSFFEEQAQNFETMLKDAEGKLTSFKKSKDVVSLESQRDIVLKQFLEQRKLKDDIKTKLYELESRIMELQKGKSGLERNEVISKHVGKNSLIDFYKEKLANLELERNKILQNYKEDSPSVMTVEENIAEMKDRLAKENKNILVNTVTGINSVYQNLDSEIIVSRAELSSTQAKLSKQEDILSKLKSELEKLNFHETEIKRLSRNLAVIENNYLLYKNKTEEARIQEAMDRSRIVNISIASPPTSSIIPLKKMRFVPRKIYYILIAMLASLSMGVVFSLLVDYYDRRIVNERDIERELNIEVLGVFFRNKQLSELMPKDEPKSIRRLFSKRTIKRSNAKG